MKRGPKPRPMVDRIWEKVDATGDCWEWTASLNDGYGAFFDNVNRKQWRAHRLVWTLLVGPIPKGMVLDHLCRVKSCVNPDHLEVVTQQENMRRGSWPGRPNCVHGHEYTPENTGLASGRRFCRTCRRIKANPHRNKDEIAAMRARRVALRNKTC